MSTDTPASPQKSQPPRFLSAIPSVAVPPSLRLDPPLTSETDEETDSPREQLTPSPDPRRSESPSGRREPASPSTADGASSAATPTSTDRPPLKPGGNAQQVAQVIGGLFVILVTTLSVLARRSGREFRQPTPEQRDDVARPLARIAVRHLPLDVIGPDLADATEAAVAAHNYAMDGPIVTRPTVVLDLGDEEPQP